MKRVFLTAAMAAFLGTVGAAPASAGPFYAVTNQVGYAGTVWNITLGTDPVATSSPRNADLYVSVDSPIDTNYNQLLSSWFSHTLSNQNNSFLQLSVDGSQSPWTATGSWDPSLTTFTVHAVGGPESDAPADWNASYSRFWQPDRGDAWGVNFIGYEYSFVATFASPAVDSGGWYVSSDASNTLLSLTGSFTGTFQRSQDAYGGPQVFGGDIYGFSIGFDKALSTPPDYAYPSGADYSPYSEFGAPVPEPATLTLLGLGLLAVGAKLRLRKA